METTRTIEEHTDEDKSVDARTRYNTRHTHTAHRTPALMNAKSKVDGALRIAVRLRVMTYVERLTRSNIDPRGSISNDTLSLMST